MFDDCHDPMVIEPGVVIDPLGTCSGQSLPAYGGVEEQTLALALATQDDIALGSAFPGGIRAALTDIYNFEDVLPWPMQNCEIFIELDMDLDGLALTDLDARWVEHGGVPSLHVDFDRATALSFISGDIEGDVEADFDIGGATIDPALSSLLVDNVGDIESILEQSTGMALSDLASDVTLEVEASLVALAGELDDAINDEVEAGYTVTSVSIDAGSLVVVTSKPKPIVKVPSFP